VRGLLPVGRGRLGTSRGARLTAASTGWKTCSAGRRRLVGDARRRWVNGEWRERSPTARVAREARPTSCNTSPHKATTQTDRKRERRGPGRPDETSRARAGARSKPDEWEINFMQRCRTVSTRTAPSRRLSVQLPASVCPLHRSSHASRASRLHPSVNLFPHE
jgi:hypothetical protein